jgi:hypothetical protein
VRYQRDVKAFNEAIVAEEGKTDPESLKKVITLLRKIKDITGQVEEVHLNKLSPKQL